jgi:hypothetical protein
MKDEYTKCDEKLGVLNKVFSRFISYKVYVLYIICDNLINTPDLDSI